MKVEEGLVGKKGFIRKGRAMGEYCGGKNNKKYLYKHVKLSNNKEKYFLKLN